MKKFFTTIILISCAQFLFAQNVREWKDINYAGDTLTGHRLDIYLPANGDGPFPVVVAIAGSAWFANNNKEWAYKQTKELLVNGFAVVVINHRSSHEVIFPAQVNDVKAAVRYIRGRASEFQLDTRFVGITGNSSGGHLSAMMGFTGGVETYTVGSTTVSIEGAFGDYKDQSSRVDAVVDWYGPTNFLVMDSCGSNMNHDAIDSPESTLVGGLIQENKEMCALANPVTYIDEDDPPILILHGDADLTVPHCQSVLLHDAVQAEGARSKLIIVPGAGHGPGMHIPKYIEEMSSFFKQEYERKISK